MVGPKVRYAQNAGVNIAYQVVGDGPRDLVLTCGTMSHLELWWQERRARAMIERLATIGRLILFDKPGTGMSDPVPAAPTIDQRTADVVAVMDAAGSERATLLGYSEGAIPCVVLAATLPQRVEALVVIDSPLVCNWSPSVPLPRESFDRIWRILRHSVENWGEGHFTAALAPTLADDPAMREALCAIERVCMSPGMARSVLLGYDRVDVREAARSVHVPTLVLHLDSDDSFFPREMGPYNASLIEGAVFKKLRGPDHMIWIDNSDLVPDLIAEFLTGRAAAPRDDDRILTTVVFTDIVESTQRLAGLGDAEWRMLLADHDRRMDDLLARYGGEALKHTGDGRLVHFARPARAVRFAAEMVGEARRCGLHIRAGIHTGECESVNGDLFGLAVVIASRITDLAGAGEVVVSSTVKDLVVGSGLSFTDAGSHELKGLPGEWHVHRYEVDRPGPLVAAGYDTDVRQPVG
jgi:class 3 adenylate cyclase